MDTRRLTRRQVLVSGVVGMAGLMVPSERARAGSPQVAAAEAAGTLNIGGDLMVRRLGFGAMRITGAGIWGEPRDPAEARRVLKPGGRLFLTVPQSWEIHEAPRDYFRFTRYGLEMILRGAGFEELSIVPRGGYFYFLAERVRHLPRYVKRERLWAIPLPHKTGCIARPAVRCA